ncbi:MAG: hypothetical protein HY369_05550 [Candidatus Aenigmarchaeota archaeon]|nr:hypothetical protein [Candidatus Aenigmarchaeota archaeon]
MSLTGDGSLHVNNGHLIPKKRKGEIQFDDQDWNDGRGFMCNPYLELQLSDLPPFEEVIEHWRTVRPHFLERRPYGVPMGGHISTTYTYPDGRSVRRDAKGDPTKLIRGRPFDTRFPSDGCTYIEGHPFEQHYRHGRHDYYLEKGSVMVEDERTIQDLEGEQPEAVLELLKFISSAKTPREALESFVVPR